MIIELGGITLALESEAVNPNLADDPHDRLPVELSSTVLVRSPIAVVLSQGVS